MGAIDANYDITYAAGTLSVTKVSITVVNTDRSKVYGSILTNTDYSGSITGVVAGDVITVTRASTGDVASATVLGSTYPIVGTLVDPGSKLGNYIISNPDGALTVDKATLTINATEKNRLCGQTNPVFSGTYTGAKNGEIFVVGGTTTATFVSEVNTYPITPTVSGSTLDNYNVINNNGTLSILGVNIDASANITPQPVKTSVTYVTIKVTDKAGLVASGVLVSLYVDDKPVVTCNTNSSGIATFNLGLLASDVYRLRAIAGSGCNEVTVYMPVYDPIGGFITGGGWINSPVYSELQYMQVGGKANFGFVSKYEKGKTVPSGNTEFQFKEGGMNFSSTSFDWLVISGKKAQYKGTGTINGIGVYGFVLTAIDGDFASPTTVDLFRIKIYDKLTNRVVYDNQYGTGTTIDDADPTTAISGGSIVIHEVKKNTGKAELVEKKSELLPFNVMAYPNPSSQYFIIAMKGASNEKVEIVVYDVLGRKVKQIEDIDGQEIKLGEKLPSGAYIAIVRQGVNQKAIRLIKE